MDVMQGAAFWLAVLCTFLMWPQLLAASHWLGEAVFADQVTPDMLELMKWALFVIVVMIMLSFARLAWGSSAAVVAIWALTKLPIF
ncbi:MAG: hypothetical protein AAFX54_12800 [Pseudomonadota bacterium]